MSLLSLSKPAELTWIQWLVHFLVIFLLVGDSVPGINESHYLPKAYHVWDHTFAPGDLFLESANSHGLFSFFAGSMACMMPLSAVAWLGRIGCWALASLAWTCLARSMRIRAAISPLAMAGWIVATAWLNWAGEWAVGGFEAKSMAYPLILLALASLADSRWFLTWIWLGGATAWHPLVGGWAAISIFIVWLVFYRSQAPFKQQLPWLCLSGVLSLVGVVPAAWALSGPSTDGNVVAAQIHAFLRLAHHQTPHLFAVERHFVAAANLALLTVATWLTLSAKQRYFASKAGRSTVPDDQNDDEYKYQKMKGLLAVAWMSVAISILGLAIDLGPVRSGLAASLLRFYWFRWSDVAVPLGWTIALWMWASAANSPRANLAMEQTLAWTKFQRLCVGTLSVVTIASMGWIFYQRMQSSVPPADRRLMADKSTAAANVGEVVFEDWKDVCRWIEENSPGDSLWLTPRFQQTFKWYAKRAEVVSWKDVPQDNRSLFEWYERFIATAYPKDSNGEIRGWTSAEIRALSRRFGFKWIVVDRRIQREPLAFEMSYPPTRSVDSVSFAEDRTYAIYRIWD